MHFSLVNLIGKVSKCASSGYRQYEWRGWNKGESTRKNVDVMMAIVALHKLSLELRLELWCHIPNPYPDLKLPITPVFSTSSTGLTWVRKRRTIHIIWDQNLSDMPALCRIESSRRDWYSLTWSPRVACWQPAKLVKPRSPQGSRLFKTDLQLPDKQSFASNGRFDNRRWYKYAYRLEGSSSSYWTNTASSRAHDAGW